MFSFRLFLFLHHYLLLLSGTSATTDYILLSCGAAFNKITSPDMREWSTDSQPKYTKSPNILNSVTSASNASEQHPSVDQIPYSTARIIHSKFTYTFPVSSAGQKFLRLYFYPTNYSPGFDKTKSFFSVDAPNHTLLFNFSAFLNLKPRSFTLVREFIVTVDQNHLLEVTFTPSQNSYAFVNGIEVVSIPDKLYIKGSTDDSEDLITLVGQKSGFNIDDSMVLEKLYRLNVGSGDISSTGDTHGMFRSWEADDSYVLSPGFTPYPYDGSIRYTPVTPAYTAPENVYKTCRTMTNQGYGYNLTWIFEVDSGFNYLLRLYFCEYLPQVSQINDRVFSIYIGNQTAEPSADVIYWSGGRGIPVYKDYVVFVNDDGSKGKQDLWLAMHPNNEGKPHILNAILNGLEIFKISKTGGSLAAPNPELVASPPVPPQGIPKSTTSNSRAYIIGGAVGGVILFLVLIGGFVLLLFRHRSVKSDDESTNNSSGLPSVRSKKFSLEEIISATNKFDDNFVIGTGGFGNVYKGYMEEGSVVVAIKRLNSSSRQGALEFQTEINMLSNLRHLHLVSLIGYCDDNGEMILVYDYMVNGTLRSHLYRGNNPPLSWKQRLQICIGAAKGLHYLHTGAERVIIHRDVKSSNILLDEKMVAKVSDFGLSKMGLSDDTLISTVVKGSFGYLDPEYYKRRQLSSKSDVYSFGVVLFEVLCGRAVVMPELPKDQVNLGEWARNCYRKGNLGEIVDKNLMGEIALESLNKFGEVGYSCLREHGIDRPTMSDIVWSLEFALQLQESSEEKDHKILETPNRKNDHLFSTQIVSETTSTTSSSSNNDGFKSGSGFSETQRLI